MYRSRIVSAQYRRVFYCSILSAGLLLFSNVSVSSPTEQSVADQNVDSKLAPYAKETAFIGVMKAAIGGTGRSAKSAIGGTGRSAKSAIGGTGRSAKAAIGGTGRSAKSAIGGTGRSVKSAIGGTGRSAKAAIGGTGRSAKSAIGGTGRSVKAAIGGTGRSAKSAIGGTGRYSKLNGSQEESFGSNAVYARHDEAADLPLLRGRVEAWDDESGIVQVLGQKLKIENASVIVDAIIEIEGLVDSDGQLAASFAWIDTSEPYVDGASELVVTGKVTAVAPEVGKLRIGELIVDYTATLWTNSPLPSLGSIVYARGIRPNSEGEFIAVEVGPR